MAIVPLQKQELNKAQYEQVIDTNFTQLIPVSPQQTVGNTLPTISQFFQYYQSLFFQIPKLGTTDSHQYLVLTSQDYIGSETGGNEVVDALIAEITALRQENLDLQQQLAQNTTLSVQDALQTIQNLNG